MLRKLLKRPEVIGWREWVALPKLGIDPIKVKIDTGARTSALHAIETRRFRDHLKDKLEFIVHPMQRNEKKEVVCRATLLDMRTITDSGGKQEHRYVIETLITIGKNTFPIELTLTNRSTMGFRMLLGRSALKHRFIINPSASYLTRKVK